MASRVLPQQWGGKNKQKTKHPYSTCFACGRKHIFKLSARHAGRRWWRVHPLCNFTLTLRGDGWRARGPPPVSNQMKNTWYAPPIKHRDAVILLALFILYIWAPDVVILYHTRTKTSCHCSAAQSSWLTRLFWGVAHQSESGRLSHWDGHPEREIQTSTTEEWVSGSL